MSEPCWFCEVRGDVGCRHRPAEGTAPIEVGFKQDGRLAKISGGGNYRITTNKTGNGGNFHIRKKPK